MPTFDIELDDDTFQRLARRAEAEGKTVEVYLGSCIEEAAEREIVRERRRQAQHNDGK